LPVKRRRVLTIPTANKTHHPRRPADADGTQDPGASRAPTLERPAISRDDVLRAEPRPVPARHAPRRRQAQVRRERIDVAIEMLQSGHWFVRTCSLAILAMVFAVVIVGGAEQIGVASSGQVVDSSGIYVQ